MLPAPDGRAASAPERELHSFIDSVAKLIGLDSTRVLTEIWLDELACLDCAPEPDSNNWRVVSFAASTKLATKLIDLQLTRLERG